jgi:hypothetical protein
MIKRKVSVYVKRIAWGIVLGILGIAMVLLWWTEGWVWYIDEPVYHRILCSLPLPTPSTYEACGVPYSSPIGLYWEADYLTTWDQPRLESFYTTELPALGWDFVDQWQCHTVATCMLFTSEQRRWVSFDRYWLVVKTPNYYTSEQECSVLLASTPDEQSLKDRFK